MKNLFIRIQALILAIFMTVSLTACNNKNSKAEEPSKSVSVGELLDNKEIADMTELDENKGNFIIKSDIDGKEENIVDAFDNIMRVVRIHDMLPDMDQFKMEEDKNPLDIDETRALFRLSDEDIKKLIEESTYSGVEFGSVEKAQTARRKLAALIDWSKEVLSIDGYEICASFLGDLVKCAVAEEFDVSPDDVGFTFGNELSPSGDKDATVVKVLHISVRTGDGVKEFDIEQSDNPLYNAAAAACEAANLGGTKITEEDYASMKKYGEIAEELLTRGVNLSSGQLVPQNDQDYANTLILAPNNK